MKTLKKILIITIVVLLLLAGGWVFIHFFWVFGTGVKAGELNQVVYKGWVWKTYEGRLIQTGFKSKDTGGKSGTNSLQSNEFNFSVVSKEVADSLMLCSGKNVELHYKEYNGWLPWRGMQRYIVDHIVSVREGSGGSEIPIFVGGESL